MASKTEESSYETYVRTTSKREIWKLSITEYDTTDHSENDVTTEAKNFTDEKEELQELNNQLSKYIDQVKELEETNKDLKSQLNQWRSKPLRVEKTYKEEIKKLQDEQKVNEEKISELNIDLNILKAKHEEEIEMRKKAEESLDNFKKTERKATAQCVKMEKNVKFLVQEITFLEKVIKELSEEQKSSEYIMRTEEMRREHETNVKKYRQEVEITKTELETLKSTNISQEKKLKETETKLEEKIEKYKSEIYELKMQLTSTEVKMTTQLSAYEELRRVNVKLDDEIRKYRELLEDGKSRINKTKGEEEGKKQDDGSDKQEVGRVGDQEEEEVEDQEEEEEDQEEEEEEDQEEEELEELDQELLLMPAYTAKKAYQKIRKNTNFKMPYFK